MFMTDAFFDAGGNPIWVSEDQVRALWSRSGKRDLHSYEDVPATLDEAILRTVAESLYWTAVHAERGELLPNGCFPLTPSHFEQEFANDAGLTPLVTMVERAKEALEIKVVSVEQGFFYGALKTRVEGEVLERFRPVSVDRMAKTLVFYLPSVDFKVEQGRVCKQQPGLRVPEEGDELLLLGRVDDPVEGLFAVANYFRVKGGRLTEQPYGFIEGGIDQSLASLSQARLNVGQDP